VFPLITLPWLNAYTGGPTAAVYPWLFAAACAVVVVPLRQFLTVRELALGWALAAVLSVGMGLVQYFGWSHTFSPWVFSFGPGEAFGNLRQRNHFATLTSIGLLSLLWWWAQVHSRWAQVLVAVAVVCLALGNATSGSRTGLMQWVLVAVLALAWARSAQSVVQRQVAVLALGAAAVYGVAVWFMPWLLETTTGFSSTGLLGRLGEEAGCATRSTLYANVLHLIAQHPWAGWGWGELGYAHLTTLYPGERFCDILDNAHNLPLHLAVELGVPVAVLCTLGLGVWVWQAKPWRETDAARQLAWGVLTVIGLHSLLEYPLWYGPFQMAVALALWVLYAPKIASISGFSQMIQGLAATVLIGVLAYAIWDYWRVSQLYLEPAQRAPAYQAGTLEKVRNSVFFQDQVRFAELSTTTLNKQNAQHVHDLALQVLHFSPEASVMQKLIESCVMLNLDDEAKYYLLRYKRAFPKAHAAWMRPT
jgi:O-antigen ligase